MAPQDVQKRLLRQHRLAPVLLVAVLLAAAGVYVVPRGFEAGHLFSIEDDPEAIAERALAASFNSDLANREIESALAAKDSDLAKSFVDLAADRQVTLAPGLADKVNVAVAEDASAGHAAQSFAYGLVTGEPSDMPGLAGTALGDLFVFGDIRDAVREGARLASGQEADELILGLACVGLAITAGTYATGGLAAPARVGLTVAKVARKTGRLSAGLAARVSRMLRGVVDGPALRRAAASFSITEPQLAVRAARDAVKLERADGLVDMARNVGRVQAKAGTQAALDGLKIAESPAEVARVAKLAEKTGSRTRAILKTAGRGAIALSLAAFNLTTWIVSALFTLTMFIASLKSATERGARRYFRYRKRRRMEREADAAFPV
ncbi:hypothetical protein [Undibacter mobilis]|uniref:hypothetical protein n=1 Tax=Undibacter mobilis TaxID=2292256 RepID=UPI001AECA92E|nr:hypothetical protein [Undibacter mobilis]